MGIETTNKIKKEGPEEGEGELCKYLEEENPSKGSSKCKGPDEGVQGV